MSIYGLQQAGTCPAGSTPYIIRPGDTLYVLAQRSGTTVAAILAVNPGLNPNNLQVNQTICLPGGPTPPPATCPNGTFYTIQPGDTFYALAVRFGISLQSLLAANPGVNPNALIVGQQICIPGAQPSYISTPCCATLSLAPGAPPDASGENPIGVVLVRQIAMSTRSVSFLGAGLPNPRILGAFDAYQGRLTISRPEAAPAPVAITALLTPSTMAPALETYAGTAITTELPQTTDVVEIRLYNTSTGTAGAAVLRGTLTGCRR